MKIPDTPLRKKKAWPSGVDMEYPIILGDTGLSNEQPSLSHHIQRTTVLESVASRTGTKTRNTVLFYLDLVFLQTLLGITGCNRNTVFCIKNVKHQTGLFCKALGFWALQTKHIHTLTHKPQTPESRVANSAETSLFLPALKYGPGEGLALQKQTQCFFCT